MWTYVLIAVIIIWVLLPPRLDPAIRLKLWMIKKGWIDD